MANFRTKSAVVLFHTNIPMDMHAYSSIIYMCISVYAQVAGLRDCVWPQSIISLQFYFMYMYVCMYVTSKIVTVHVIICYLFFVLVKGVAN